MFCNRLTEYRISDKSGKEWVLKNKHNFNGFIEKVDTCMFVVVLNLCQMFNVRFDMCLKFVGLSIQKQCE